MRLLAILCLFLCGVAHAQERTLIVTGSLYYSDGKTPIKGIGGKDWKVQLVDPQGDEKNFEFTYSGNTYNAYAIDRSKIPKNRVNVRVWYGKILDAHATWITTLTPSRINFALEDVEP